MRTHLGRQFVQEFARCVIECDVDGLDNLWRKTNPTAYRQLPREKILELIHRKRATTMSLPLALRRESEQWLKDHDLGRQRTRQRA